MRRLRILLASIVLLALTCAAASCWLLAAGRYGLASVAGAFPLAILAAVLFRPGR